MAAKKNNTFYLIAPFQTPKDKKQNKKKYELKMKTDEVEKTNWEEITVNNKKKMNRYKTRYKDKIVFKLRYKVKTRYKPLKVSLS